MGLTLAPNPERAAATPLRIRPEVDLLLASLRASVDPRAGAQLGPLFEQPIDWGQLVWLAHRQNTLPALFAGLKMARSPHVPAAIYEQLGGYAESSARRRQAQLDELRGLRLAFEAAGIRFTGFRSTSFLCREGAVRDPEPIDVLVLDDADQAQALLERRGYSPLHPLNAAQTTAMRQARGASVLHNGALGIRLHMWDRASPDSFAIGPTARDLWHRRRPAADQGLPDGLSTEDLLVTVCVQGAFHLWGPIAWVADLAHLMASREVNWDRAIDIARDTGAERPLLLGLLLAKKLMGAELPASLGTRATNDAGVQTLAGQIEAGLHDDLRGRLTELERARFRVQSLERLSARLRYTIVFALQPDLDDFSGNALPNALFPLYHLTRPARLVSLLLGRIFGRRTRAPFLPSPMPVVEHMLAMAEVTKEDIVYDLGCGDGRIVIEAAARYGAHCVGVDLDRDLLAQAQKRAEAAGVDHLISFVQGDALDIDLTPATVVTLWTVPDLNLQLRPRLRSQLQAGARVVGHSFDMGDWAPQKTELIQNEDDVMVAYLWAIPRGE